MAEPDVIPQEVGQRIEQIGAADLVVGLPECESPEEVQAATRKVQTARQMLSPALKIVLVHSYRSTTTESNGELPEPAQGPYLWLLSFPRPLTDPLISATNSAPGTYRDVFKVSQLLGGKACAVMGSDPESITPESLRLLAEPVLDRNSDLVVACYPRHKFDSLINNSIVSPLIRALYGKRIQYPMARDLGFSDRAIEKLSALLAGNAGAARSGSPASIVTEALSDGLQVSQTYLETRNTPPKTPPDVSSVLVQVLSPLFVDVERTAAFWQKVRGSQRLPTFGQQGLTAEESTAVDVTPMIEAFHLGFRDLREVWNLVLPPATMIGLKKLTELPKEQFQMPDTLWVRIIYDFVLGFRLRVMNRDHLLRALTPLYLAWVASYGLEMQNAIVEEVEERIERLCGVYEAQKPYLQSRWRWPDRFNP